MREQEYISALTMFGWDRERAERSWKCISVFGWSEAEIRSYLDVCTGASERAENERTDFEWRHGIDRVA